VLVPLPPAVSRAIDRTVDDRHTGAILLNRRGRRMDRRCATRRLRRLAGASVVRLPRMHPHMLRHIVPAYVSDFRTQALGRLAAQHEEILRLRAATARNLNVTRLPARQKVIGPC
jgi:site-specific recombinase XerC